MATFKTHHKGAGIDGSKLAPPSMASEADSLRLDRAPVHDDIVESCAAGGTLTGPVHSFDGATQRIIAAGWASAPGALFLDTSSDGGATWTKQDGDNVLGGDSVTGCAVADSSENAYRLRFVCGPVGANRVSFHSQARS